MMNAQSVLSLCTQLLAAKVKRYLDWHQSISLIFSSWPQPWHLIWSDLIELFANDWLFGWQCRSLGSDWIHQQLLDGLPWTLCHQQEKVELIWWKISTFNEIFRSGHSWITSSTTNWLRCVVFGKTSYNGMDCSLIWYRHSCPSQNKL